MIFFLKSPGNVLDIYLWMSLKSPKMSWKVLESPGILNLKCCGHHVKEEHTVIMQDMNYVKFENSLNLYKDEKGLLRSRTRINEVYNVIFNNKHPLLLRKASNLKELVILKAHSDVNHGKTDATLNEIRIKYCLIKGRQSVKKILKNCVPCNTSQAKVMLPPSTPNLPKFRVSYEYPFEVTGLDYAGPFYAKNMYGKRYRCYE